MPEDTPHTDEGWVRQWPKGRRVEPLERRDLVSFSNATLVRIERLEKMVRVLTISVLVLCAFLGWITR